MALHTRRRVLLGAAGLLAGLAGCNDEPGEAGTPAASPTEPGRPRDPGDTGVRDPERRVLRHPGEGPLAWFAEDGTTANGTTDRTIPPHEREHEGLIASDPAARTLVAADVVERLRGLAYVEAFATLQKRVEDGAEFGVESVAEVRERREAAVSAVETALEESPDRRLAGRRSTRSEPRSDRLSESRPVRRAGQRVNNRGGARW
ncbi:MAG: hypothetical protein V5A44_00155 [Haloarculaceae archaeon]